MNGVDITHIVQRATKVAGHGFMTKNNLFRQVGLSQAAADMPPKKKSASDKPVTKARTGDPSHSCRFATSSANPSGGNQEPSRGNVERIVEHWKASITVHFDEIISHDGTEDCVACRAQNLVAAVLVPAATAWETAAALPRFSIALHGAAGLLGSQDD
jgi:hypothetical protein